jgi:hypothetical protein
MGAVAISYPDQDVWSLACATKWDAREAASDIVGFCGQTAHFAQAGVSIITAAVRIRGEFKRIVERQGKLLERLEPAPVAEWTQEDCAGMAELLGELNHDVKEIIACGLSSSARRFWGRPLQELAGQAERIERVYLHLDALSACPSDVPANQDFVDYVAGLDLSQMHDVSLERERRRFPAAI